MQIKINPNIKKVLARASLYLLGSVAISVFSFIMLLFLSKHNQADLVGYKLDFVDHDWRYIPIWKENPWHISALYYLFNTLPYLVSLGYLYVLFRYRKSLWILLAELAFMMFMLFILASVHFGLYILSEIPDEMGYREDQLFGWSDIRLVSYSVIQLIS